MVEEPSEALEALRAGRDPEVPRLDEPARLTRHVWRSAAGPTTRSPEAFLAPGFGEQRVLEVVTGVVLETLGNDTDHIAGTLLDEAFGSPRWTAAAA